MSEQVLILGGTGMLGVPVTRHLVEKGHVVRVLTRSPEKAQRLFENQVEIVVGDLTNRNMLEKAVNGCNAVHISLPTESELVAVRHVLNSAAARNLNRISYISGTSVREGNRSFEMTERKARAELMLRRSGIPYIVFCPTWVMEVLHRFVRGDRAAIISSRNRPAIHFFAAEDFGRMVALAYEDERAFGKRLFIHGPQGLTLPNALKALLDKCYPHVKATHLRLWQARLIARMTGRMGSVSRLIQYFDKVGELGDPTEANALLGAPSTTLGKWIESQKRSTE
jgi:uncharacterized protein YbjT (DUF2867 family)